ncbi:hypothetical protein JCM8202v2_003912 [Rhodotorula sphaerocarpa]
MARPTQKRARQRDGDSADDTDYSSDADARQKKNRTRTKAGRAGTQAKGKGNKGKGKGKRARDASDDEDAAASSSDLDSSDDGDGAGGKGKAADLNEDEKKFYIQAMVRYVLFNESHRRVLRRQDIVKAVLTDGRGKHFNSLLPKVQKILREVLGLDLALLPQPKTYTVRSLVPVPLLRHSLSHPHSALATLTDPAHFVAGAAPSDVGGGRKTLRSELVQWARDGDGGDDEDEDEEGERGVEAAVMRDVKREEGALYGILGVVLALILVNGRVLGDDQLISYLKRLSLTPSTPLPLSLSAPHPDALTLAKYLELLVRQQYLECANSGQGGATGATQAQTQTQGGRSGRPSTGGTQRKKRGGGAGDGERGGAGAEAGDPALEWRWGPRAEAELGEKGVGQFVERIFFDPSAMGRKSAGINGEEEEAAQAGQGARRGKNGERFLKELARAAGVKELAGTEGLAKGGGAAGGSGDEEEEE